MTPARIKELFPHASASTIRLNSDCPSGPAPAPVVERPARSRALGTRKAQKADTGVFLVRVTSRRRRLLDEDNLAEKYHVDCCRYAGLVPGDAAGQARIETRQEKVGRKEDECTVIEISQL
jgi:hypothetical protein